MKLFQIGLHEFITLYEPLLALSGLREASAHRGIVRSALEISALWAQRKRGVSARWWAVETENGTLPFMEMPDNFAPGNIWTHPHDVRLFDLHRIYRSYLAPYMATTAETVGKGIHWPLVEALPYVDFETFLRQGMKIKLLPHFFGSKAKQVVWHTVRWHDLREVERHQIIELSLRHRLDYDQRNPDELDPIMAGWEREWEMPSEMVVAFDLSGPERTVVAAMLILGGNSTDNADLICRDPDPRWRPYSLILAAQAAAVRESLYCRHRRLNLGLNFGPTPYKEAIPYRAEPLYNMPPVDPGDDATTIYDRLQRKADAYHTDPVRANRPAA